MEAGVAHTGEAAHGRHALRPRAPDSPPSSRARAKPRAGVRSRLVDYIALTKPRVISLLLLTTACAMVVADPGAVTLPLLGLTLLGGYLAAGGAGAINHVLERDLDARMGRTSSRPIAAGRIGPVHGLAFGLLLGASSMAVLAIGVNVVAAGLALAGLLGYVFVYTLWLKPSTPHNIVIGGAAGAFPPLVGWAAATGGLDAQALWLFAIVFMWTPPHFWALSLLIKGDYQRGGVPMLPVVRGEEETRRQIVLYAALLLVLSMGPVLTGLLGFVYLAAALVLGSGLLALALRLRERAGRQAARRLYLSSLLYLALLFCAMALDRAL